jgi:peptidoglycan hydrolase CwlO-like protein
MLETGEKLLLDNINTPIFATTIGLILGVIFKLFNLFTENSKSDLETHLALRKELREELDTVKEELQKLQTELDEWKQKYYNQVEITNELKLAIVRMREELNEQKKNLDKFN